MDLRLTWIEIYELSHEWAKQVLQPWQHEHPVPNIHRVSNFFFISALDECYPKFNIHRVSNIFFISALDECYPKFITEYVIIYFMYVLLIWVGVIVWKLSSSGSGGTPPKIVRLPPSSSEICHHLISYDNTRLLPVLPVELWCDWGGVGDAKNFGALSFHVWGECPPFQTMTNLRRWQISDDDGGRRTFFGGGAPNPDDDNFQTMTPTQIRSTYIK